MARRKPPFTDHSFAALGWAHRAAEAVGSPRFAETITRAEFYFAQAARHSGTPGEGAIVTGLQLALDELVAADAAARVLLGESVSGMSAADATEFVELCEAEDEQV